MAKHITIYVKEKDKKVQEIIKLIWISGNGIINGEKEPMHWNQIKKKTGKNILVLECSHILHIVICKNF